MDFMDCVSQKKQQDVTVFIGDVVDHHGISRWVKHWAAPGPKDEYELALEGVQRWYRRFPEAIVCIGNHDERPVKMAEQAGIPGAYLKDYATVWQTPRWKWVEEITLLPDDEQRRVYIEHGTGRGGVNPAANLAKDQTTSTAVGHIHHTGGCKWFQNTTKRWFGLDTGALIDDRLYGFAYSKPCKKKTALGCGFIDTDNPMDTQFIAMPAGPGEKFSRENYPIHPLLKDRLA